MNAYQEFVYYPDRHETSEKTFSFPIYANGGHTIPARDESEGIQDGIDLITALASHPETARRLARKFWEFFVSEIAPPDPDFVESTAAVYLENDTEIRPVIRHVLTSGWFNDPATYFARYSWPVEYVGRAIVKWAGRTCRSTESGRRSPTWASCCSSRQTSAGGPWAPAGFQPARCWRG
jgi:uncharacterized protein (DUF1800 family)